jgi:hypothetical protein
MTNQRICQNAKVSAIFMNVAHFFQDKESSVSQIDPSGVRNRFARSITSRYDQYDTHEYNEHILEDKTVKQDKIPIKRSGTADTEALDDIEKINDHEEVIKLPKNPLNKTDQQIPRNFTVKTIVKDDLTDKIAMLQRELLGDQAISLQMPDYSRTFPHSM